MVVMTSRVVSVASMATTSGTTRGGGARGRARGRDAGRRARRGRGRAEAGRMGAGRVERARESDGWGCGVGIGGRRDRESMRGAWGWTRATAGGDGFGSGRGGGGGGGGGGDDDGGEEGEEEDEDDGVLARDVRERASAEEVKTRCEENGLEVPRDLLDADGGTMRASTLDLYIKYSKYSALAFLMNTFPAVRDRMLADPRFAFKLMVETGADVVMNTATEIKQRGDVFWDEFEFFACDQIAAFAVNTAILTICSPAIVLGNTTRSMRKLGELSKNANGAAKVWYVARKYVGKLPANVFMLDPKLGMMAKLARGGATVIARGGQIFFVSTLCGTVGQATANSLMMLRRAAGRDKYSKGYAESIDVSVDPPVLDTGLLWGRFMMFSANIRQQLVVGGERAVEQFTAGMPSASGRRLANGATVALRVFNNLKGGSDFNDFVIGQAIAEASRRDGGHA